MVKSSIKNIIEVLKNSTLFSHIKEEELSELAVKHCTQKQFKKGSMIFSRKNSEKRLGIICKGTAQISNGKVIIGRLKAYDILGAEMIYGKAEHYLNDISALTDCKVVFVDKEGIDSIFSKSVSFAKKYISHLSENICSLNKKIDAYTAPSAEEKLYSYLLSEAKADTVTLDMKMTELSKQLNLSRASLYRVIDTLEKSNKIIREGNKITLL